jgi:hypothetical protein
VALWAGTPPQVQTLIGADEVELIENVRDHRAGRLSVRGGGRELSGVYAAASAPELEGLLAGFRRTIAFGSFPLPEADTDVTRLPGAWFLALSHERARLRDDEAVSWKFESCGGLLRRRLAALALVGARELVLVSSVGLSRSDTTQPRRTIYVPRHRLRSVTRQETKIKISTDGGASAEAVLPPALTSWLSSEV